jgi:hypothetical protein
MESVWRIAALGGETKKDMESLETYAGKWLKAVRD